MNTLPTYILLLLLAIAGSTPLHSQEVQSYFGTKVPVIKDTKLTRVNGTYTFKTSNWHTIKNKNVAQLIAGLTNGKNAQNSTIQSVQVLGWWPLSDGVFAYLYATTTAAPKPVTTVYIASYSGINNKQQDIDPFSQSPNPTGMQSKVQVTNSLSISSFGGCTLLTTHKSASGKVLLKEVTYTINEDGTVSRL